MIAAVLFDLDGTLIDHDAAIEEAAGALFKKLLPDATMRDRGVFIERWKALNREWYLRFFARSVTFQESGRGKLREAFVPYGIQFSEIAADAALAEYWGNYVRSCCVFDDVRQCLSGLSGYKVGIITNGQEAQQVAKIKHCDVLRDINLVVTAEAAGCPKPDARIFALACRKAGICPQEAVYVGNDFELDVAAARNAGLASIWLSRPTLEPRTGPGEISSIPSLAQLGDALRRLAHTAVPG